MVLHSQPVSLRAGLCRVVAAATALAVTAAGCSYHSTYVAPEDGRARVVWGSGDAPTVEMSGAGVSAECNAAIHNLTEDSGAPRSSSRVEVHSVYVSGGGYWAPHYYGPPIVVVRPGFAPPIPRTSMFITRGGLPAPMAAPPIRVGTGVSVGTPVRVGTGISSGSHSIGAPVRSGGGGGGGSGGGGGGGDKALGAVVIVLAVIAMTTLPVVALGLAASMPESSGKSSTAIDLVNTYNDLARREGSPCVPAPYPAPVGYPPPQEQPQ